MSFVWSPQEYRRVCCCARRPSLRGEEGLEGLLLLSVLFCALHGFALGSGNRGYLGAFSRFYMLLLKQAVAFHSASVGPPVKWGSYHLPHEASRVLAHDWIGQPSCRARVRADSRMLPPPILCVVGLGWNILVFCGSAQPPLSRIPAVCTMSRSRAVFRDSTESGLPATCWGRASDP